MKQALVVLLILGPMVGCARHEGCDLLEHRLSEAEESIQSLKLHIKILESDAKQIPPLMVALKRQYSNGCDADHAGDYTICFDNSEHIVTFDLGSGVRRTVRTYPSQSIDWDLRETTEGKAK